MKTKINALIATLTLTLVLVVVTGTRKTVKAAEPVGKGTVLAYVNQINKIEINGNIEVLIHQDFTESLKMYDDYHSKKASVQWEEGVLRITSFEKERLTVLVNVTDLRSVVASGNAVIRSLNKISSIDLQIRLEDKVTAVLNAQVLNLSTHLTGLSSLELSGEAENQFVELTGAAKLNAGTFHAQSRSVQLSDDATAVLGNTEIRSAAVASANNRIAKGF